MSDDPTAQKIVELREGARVQYRTLLLALGVLENEAKRHCRGVFLTGRARERAERVIRAVDDEARVLGDQIGDVLRRLQRLDADLRELKGAP